MKRLWTENGVSGIYGQYSFKNVTMEPKPLQKPHPPLWMGGYVDTVLRRVGKFADGWISYFYTPNSFEKSWTKVLGSAKSAGKAQDSFGNCDMVPIRIDRNEAQARQVANRFIQGYCDLPKWSEATPQSAIVGSPKDCARMVELFLKAGVQELVLIPSVGQLSEIDEQLDRTGKELLPSFT